MLGVLHEPRFIDLAPAQVYANLLDEGTYPCSESTMYRVLAREHEVRPSKLSPPGVSNSLTGSGNPVPRVVRASINGVSASLWRLPILRTNKADF